MSRLTWAGFLGPLLFVVVAVTLGVQHPGYSFVTSPVVALVEGPNGWVQSANLVLLGTSVIAFAIGLHFAVRRSRFGAAGPLLLGAGGIGPVWAGLTAPMPVHFAVTFVGAGLGFVLLSRRLAHDPRWRGVSSYALATGVAILVVLPIHSLLALPEGGPLHEWWGLLNWTALVLWLAGLVVLASRQLVGRAGQQVSSRPSRADFSAASVDRP